MTERWCYDVECLKNIFTVTFVNVNDKSDIRVFYVGLNKTDYSDLLKFLKTGDMTLIGYNNHSYDDAMLRFIMTYRGDKVNTELYNLSIKLVDDNFRSDRKLLELRYPKKIIYPWKSIDLMRILAFDKLGISLKQTAINLKWHRIQDMPVRHDAYVQDTQLKTILDYNLNDALITNELYEEITPLRKLRDELSVLYSVDLSSASDSKMANLILENIYGKEMRMDIRTIRDMRTVRDKVLLGNCIAKFVKFESPELKEMLDRVSSTIVYNYNRYKYSENIYFANCNFTLGVGGLHTEDEPGIFVSDENYIIQDMDVASYYPNLIINNNFYPEHLGIDFIRVLKKITEERLSAKRSGDKVKADGLKITVNSIFGKLGSEHFWLLDAKQLLSTTLSGQMGLLMLVEGLHLNGIHVISCNTDGVVCKIPRELESKYYEIAKAWEKATNMKLEFTFYKKYVRRDVNSYITEMVDGSTKEKGAFLKEVDLKKAYHMPIVAKALYAYYIKGIPIKKTIEDCRDIMEFCISQKTGVNYQTELRTPKKIEKLQKTNRFYIAKTGGSIVKREETSGKLIGLYVGKLVRILNDYDPAVPFEEYDVDFSFYEKEVMKVVDEVEPKQISMFELSSLGKSSITKMKVPTVPEADDIWTEEIITVDKLNKLGKNQLVKRIETIIKNNQKIDKISPRYVYILNLDSRSMKADVYCLAKGIKQTIGVDKTAYKKSRLEQGNLVFCTKFEKVSGGHSLVDYRITSKIEEEKQELGLDKQEKV
jgi:hypothetical protein